MKIADPIPPRDMVRCMDQHIEHAERWGDEFAKVPVFELKEWRDMIDRIAGEVA